MSFDLTDEQEEFAESVRAFAQARLGADALRRAHEPGYAWDAAKLLADQGLLGLTIPEEDGGQGAGLMEAVIAIQEVAKVCPKSADVVQATNFGAIRTFAEYASRELKDRYLPGLLAGRTLLALGMTEPEAGSAATDLKTSATADGDDYLLNGSKVFSTNSPDATAFLVYVRFGPGTGGGNGFNGGGNGTTAQPTRQQETQAGARHVGATAEQQKHFELAAMDRSLYSKLNNSEPGLAATSQAGVLDGADITRSSSRDTGASRPIQ